jgi:hypothetical protein
MLLAARDAQHGEGVLAGCAAGTLGAWALLIKAILREVKDPFIVPYLASFLDSMCHTLSTLSTLSTLATALPLHQTDLLQQLGAALAVLRKRPGWLPDESQLQSWGLQLIWSWSSWRGGSGRRPLLGMARAGSRRIGRLWRGCLPSWRRWHRLAAAGTCFARAWTWPARVA